MIDERPYHRLTLRLPWMPKALSPNARVNVFQKAKAFKVYKSKVHRLVSTFLSDAVLLRHYHPLYSHGRVHIQLTFYPPAHYRYDEDNMVASFKAGADGIRDVVGIDDHWFHYIPDVGQWVVPDGCVEVTFEVVDES